MTRPGRLVLLVLLIVSALSACASPTPEQQIVNDAAQALGGGARLLQIKTLVIRGKGRQYNFGQDVTPRATGQTFTVSEYRRAIDVANGRMRTELTRTPDFVFFNGQAVQRQVNGLDGVVGYNIAPNGTATRVADTVAQDRRAEMFHHPLVAVWAALAPTATLARARTENGQSLVDVTAPSGQRFTLAIDSSTKLPRRVVTVTNNTVLGDVAVETSFDDYRDVSGVRVPARLATSTDGLPTAEILVDEQSIDAASGDLAAPADAASAPPITAPPPPSQAAEEIAPGIWFLGEGNVHAVLVEFADHLLLIDAPQDDVRTLGFIARGRELRPGKPLTQVVNTHVHFDHAGGVRAAVSEGLTVIAHEGNAQFLQDIAMRPHTIAPDALARSPKPLMVDVVRDERVITDGKMNLALYAMRTPHADAMLLPYFPRERILVLADLYNQGFVANPFVAGLVEELKQRNLRVDRVVPMHGRIVPYAQFVKDGTTPQP